MFLLCMLGWEPLAFNWPSTLHLFASARACVWPTWCNTSFVLASSFSCYKGVFEPQILDRTRLSLFAVLLCWVSVSSFASWRQQFFYVSFIKTAIWNKILVKWHTVRSTAFLPFTYSVILCSLVSNRQWLIIVPCKLLPPISMPLACEVWAFSCGSFF